MVMPKYNYVENPTKEHTGFHIQEGQYRGIIYTYGKVKFIEDKETDKLRLKFEYNVHENPNSEDINSKDFITTIGDILAVETEKDMDGNSGKNRTNSS
mgnify:FL=1|jgi:hypothetical protein|tara:strand:+ start:953 stop:1246 length:294 start_codon:yes stop_codon:yes gene_type:complete